MKAVLYVRVSKNDGDQDPDTQLHVLRAWAGTRGWRVMAEQVDRVTGDPMRRGRHPRGLLACLDAIERRKADVLAIFAADRLVRSPTHLLQLVSQVQAAGGKVASYQDGADLDTTTDQGELLLFLRGWMARMELKLNRGRTLAGLARARAAGKTFGRPRSEAPPLELVQDAMAKGIRSRSQLAKHLGCSPWAVRKALAELAKRGSADWGSSSTEPSGPKGPGE